MVLYMLLVINYNSPMLCGRVTLCIAFDCRWNTVHVARVDVAAGRQRHIQAAGVSRREY